MNKKRLADKQAEGICYVCDKALAYRTAIYCGAACCVINEEGDLWWLLDEKFAEVKRLSNELDMARVELIKALKR